MNYQETIKWLFSQLPMYQREGKSAFKKDLGNIIQLCKINDDVHQKFKSIHVGGTNGKGSVSHMLASIFQTAGYKTGLYTSPHLKDFRERIKINGIMISREDVVDFVKKFSSDFKTIKPSFFEMSVAMAFNHFAENKVDIAIVEVGLGGRLDSTNILEPILSVITNISLDHTQFLGNSTEEIAFEKAGIIKESTPVIIGETDKFSKPVFKNKAKEMRAEINFADKEYSISKIKTENGKQIYDISKSSKLIYPELTCDLVGSYQKKNIVTCLKSIEILSKVFPVNKKQLYKGLSNVIKNTGISGRWQIIGEEPLIIADTGHNEAGIKEIINQLEKIPFTKLHFVYGVVNDKDINEILKLLPEYAVYYFTKANIPRAMDEKELEKKAKKFNLHGKSFERSKSAFNSAKKNAKKSDIIFIGGSTFIVAELI